MPAQTAPVTNYGGALGGIVNLPIKVTQVVFIIGAVGIGIAFFIGGKDIEVDGVTVNCFEHFCLICSGIINGTFWGGGAMAVIIAKAADFLDAFLPVSLALSLYIYAIAVRFSVRIYFMGVTMFSRVLS